MSGPDNTWPLFILTKGLGNSEGWLKFALGGFRFPEIFTLMRLILNKWTSFYYRPIPLRPILL